MKDLARREPTTKLFGPDGVAESAFTHEAAAERSRSSRYITNPTLDPKLYPPAGAGLLQDLQGRSSATTRSRTRSTATRPCSVALQAIQNAGDKGNDRQAVIDAFFKIKNRDSVLGKYSIDENGDTTLSDYGGDTRQGRQAGVRQGHQGPDQARPDLRSDVPAGTLVSRPAPRVTRATRTSWKPHPSPRPRRPAARTQGLATSLNAYALPLLLVLALVAQFVYFSRTRPTLDDVKTGLSNGTIWALIALGYTLVYGIIELINFAHGEVFMIGSFVARVAVADRSASTDTTACR